MLRQSLYGAADELLISLTEPAQALQQGALVGTEH